MKKCRVAVAILFIDCFNRYLNLRMNVGGYEVGYESEKNRFGLDDWNRGGS